MSRKNTQNTTKTSIYRYGAPGSQAATFEFSLGFETFLTSSHHFVYVVVDGRGTAGRGESWLQSVYRRLGTLEVQDQIDAVE